MLQQQQQQLSSERGQEAVAVRSCSDSCGVPVAPQAEGHLGPGLRPWGLTQRVLPDVDQASQSLHRFLGRRGSVRELSETKWEQECIYKDMAVPNWKMLLGE